MSASGNSRGKLVRIVGPVVTAVGLDGIRLHDVVRVGDLGLVGEVIRLSGELVTVQVYEDTSGVRAGESLFAIQAGRWSRNWDRAFWAWSTMACSGRHAYADHAFAGSWTYPI